MKVLAMMLVLLIAFYAAMMGVLLLIYLGIGAVARLLRP